MRNHRSANVGQSTLKHFSVTIDCRHRIMYPEKLPDWNRRELFSRSGFLYDGQDDGDQIKTVSAGGAAEAAGLKAGDLITAINGAKPADDLANPAFNQPVDTVVRLDVRRTAFNKFTDSRYEIFAKKQLELCQ